MATSGFSEARFRSQVSVALDRISKVLEVNKRPVLADSLLHKYDDKFALAESLTNMAFAAEVVILQVLGLNPESLALLLRWVEERTVTLRFRGNQVCSIPHLTQQSSLV